MVIFLRVNTLLKKIGLSMIDKNYQIHSISFQPQKCTRDTLFISLKENPLEEIEEAIQQGVKVIISRACPTQFKEHIFVDQPRKVLAVAAKYFYHDLSRNIKLIGVTGTNGKTTTSTIAYDFFNSIGKKSMLIGSNGIFCIGYQKSIHNTTPDILTIYEALKVAKKKRIHYVFMEVSSISVDQYRIFGLKFSCMILTNFSQDHLDYHKTIEEYCYNKLVPFIKLSKKAYAILNVDEAAYDKFAKFTEANIISYGMKKKAKILGTLNSTSIEGMTFYVNNSLYKTKLIGEFNIYNCLAVLSLCKVFHISFTHFQDFLSKYSSVAGRMNVIPYKNCHIIIDYAHTFSATKFAIEAAKRFCKGNLTIVLGCGGNRERQKRFMIGNLLNQEESRIILTTDNPRYENPEEIIADIQSTMTRSVEKIVDRRTAILDGLNHLKEKDCLLVLGKGCENYMDIMGVKHPYSDQEVIYEWIQHH